MPRALSPPFPAVCSYQSLVASVCVEMPRMKGCEAWKALCAAKGSAVSMHSVCTAWTACAKCAVPASWALCVALLACSAQGGVVRCACSCRSLELADGACLMIACLRMRMASCN